MKRLLLVAVLLSFLAVPTLAQEAEVRPLRWDPTGTYIVIDEEGSCVTPGTIFLTQFIPADMTGRHFFVNQNRVSNIVSGSLDVSAYETVRGEMWRTGPRSFKMTTILYTYGASGEPSYSFVNTGKVVRRPSGEVWAEDLYFSFYFGDQNPLDPEIEPWLTSGPCSMRVVSQLEYVPPPAD